MNGWIRKAFTTQCSDPTYVVTWEKRESDIKITEFQGIYQVEQGSSDEEDPLLIELAVDLHQALESIWEARQEQFEQGQADAGYPDSKIYGEP